ncbi:unnamed protein product [Adineta steineri]|uniref:Uncharacterized protein n=2 Tax=Adineta steineri TaxID=433720 RepID=A0A814QSE1_9BILA|nr:unnamed protein product [Adineta steineri]
MYALTDGQWSPTRSSIFFTTKMNGTLDVWDILFKQNEPTVSVKVTNDPLHCLRVQEPHGRLIACGSQNGTVTLLELSNNLYVQRKNEKSLVNGMFDRETRRTKILEARSRVRRDVQEKSTNTEVITGKITDEYILKKRELVEKAEEDFWRIINEEKNKVFNIAESDQLYNPRKDTDGHKSSNYLAITEIYNPSTDQWDTIANMTAPRAAHTVILLNSEEPSSHTTTLLKSGKVLATASEGLTHALDSSEIYDPSTGKWNSSARLSLSRASHTATLLNLGKVLVAGGQ